MFCSRYSFDGEKKKKKEKEDDEALYRHVKRVSRFLWVVSCVAKAELQIFALSLWSTSHTFPITYSNKNFILKYFRCRDGKRTETRIGMEGICITHSCIPLYTVYMQHIMAHSGGMQEWVIQIPSIPILVSVLFPSLHLKYFRIKFLLLVCIVFMRMRTKPHPHPVISEATPTSSYKKGLEVLAVFALVCTFPAFS